MWCCWYSCWKGAQRQVQKIENYGEHYTLAWVYRCSWIIQICKCQCCWRSTHIHSTNTKNTNLIKCTNLVGQIILSMYRITLITCIQPIFKYRKRYFPVGWPISLTMGHSSQGCTSCLCACNNGACWYIEDIWSNWWGGLDNASTTTGCSPVQRSYVRSSLK